MSEEEEFNHPTINYDQQAHMTENVESIFTIEEDFDPQKACEKLVLREKSSEKYIIREKIAQGGMGGIYDVYDRDLKRNTVIKIIRPEIMANRQMFVSFIDEARITGQLEHPNIVPVHDLGAVEDDKLYFSMKHIEGDSLNDILKKIKDGDAETIEKYPLYPLLKIFRKCCDGVAYAHSKNIINRDIKPENIMVGNYGEVLVVDWGLARRLDEEEPAIDQVVQEDIDPLAETINERSRTRYGMIKGTPAYMPPEQAKGSADEIDIRSDIFLMGATLYAIATLSAPFRGEDVMEIIDNAEYGDFDPPDERAPERELPPELCRIILKAMAHHPDDRYQTMEDFMEDMDDLLEARTASEQRTFQAGDLLMVEGDPGKEAYVIINGEVDVYKIVNGKRISLIHLGSGDSIGEMALISDAPRSASVEALTETNAVVITEDLIKQGLDKLPSWMGNIVRALVERLRTTNANVHPLINSDCSYHVLNQFWMIYLCWGRPVINEDSKETVIVVEPNKVIKEITANLSIVTDKVTHVISTLIDSRLIDGFDREQVYVPNLSLLNQFMQYLRQNLKLESEFTDVPEISLFANNNEFVVSHALMANEGEPVELESVQSYEYIDILECETSEELGEKFQNIILALQQPPPSTSEPQAVDDEAVETTEAQDEVEEEVNDITEDQD